MADRSSNEVGWKYTYAGMLRPGLTAVLAPTRVVAASVLLLLRIPSAPLVAQEIAREAPAPGRVTMRRMVAVATAIVAYRHRHGSFPTARSAAALEKKLRPFIWRDDRRDFDVRDEWGTGFSYQLIENGNGFRLVSAGADRRFDKGSWEQPGVLEDRQHDAVLVGRTTDSSRTDSRRDTTIGVHVTRSWFNPVAD